MNDALEDYFLPCRAAFIANLQEAGLPAMGPIPGKRRNGKLTHHPNMLYRGFSLDRGQ